MRFPGWSAKEKRCVACVNVENSAFCQKKKQFSKIKKRLTKFKIYTVYIQPLLACKTAKMQERGRFSTNWWCQKLFKSVIYLQDKMI